MSFLCTLLLSWHTLFHAVNRILYFVQQSDRLREVSTSQSSRVYSHQRVCVCVQLFDIDWWRAVTHRKEGCQYALSPLSCSLSALQCTPACVMCVGCVSMSLLWLEMTLWNTAILSTVNIIQYHPTGINVVVLLLAEICCCFRFSPRGIFRHRLVSF